MTPKTGPKNFRITGPSSCPVCYASPCTQSCVSPWGRARRRAARLVFPTPRARPLPRPLAPPPRLRRLQAAPALLEQHEPEAVGELPDLGGDGRLREVQLLGGARRALVARDRLE